jgi:TolB protein
MQSHPCASRVAILSLGLALAATNARAQDTNRVSTDSAGNQSDSFSNSPSLSLDGSVISFSSGATNLVPSDTNQCWDVFVRDRTTGTTERVSVDSVGTEGNDHSSCVWKQSLSSDGMVVTFFSLATNLVSGDTNGAHDVFVHDRSTGTTVLASVDSNGNLGNGMSRYGVISADGKVVAFVSDATNLVPGDTNGVRDVFVHDLVSGATERVSVDTQGAEADGGSDALTLSADGRCVAFVSGATNLVAGDTNQVVDVFVRDRVLGTTERISVDASGNEGNGWSLAPSISADGRYVAFESYATNLVPYDTNHQGDVFLVDRTAGTIVRCSVDSAGTQVMGSSVSAVVSSSGALVAFSSDAAYLVANDKNAKQDCFLHDVQAGTTIRISVDSNGGEANDGSYQPAISGDGTVLAFVSDATYLVPFDTNHAPDVFVHELFSARRSNYGQGLAGTNGVPRSQPSRTRSSGRRSRSTSPTRSAHRRPACCSSASSRAHSRRSSAPTSS